MQDRGLVGYAIVVALQLGGLAIFIGRGGYYLVVGIVFLIPSIFAAGPYACLAIATKISNKLLKKYELSKTLNKEQIFTMVLWGGSYLVAWRFAVVRTLELYAELPVSQPPDCYIATAAARGNPSLVYSIPIEIQGGGTLHVNAQLRYLKCAELTLKSVFPWGHLLCRRLYDHYGKILSRKITTSGRAGLAYFSLKPLEWGSRVVLKLIVPNLDEIASRLYTNF
jgi:hypothetical protein